VYFVQMMLRHGFGHELLYAFVKGAIKYNIWAGTKRRANTFAFKRRPFPEDCGNIKFDFGISSCGVLQERSYRSRIVQRTLLQ
jgi:hypothetical protein